MKRLILISQLLLLAGWLGMPNRNHSWWHSENQADAATSSDAPASVVPAVLMNSVAADSSAIPATQPDAYSSPTTQPENPYKVLRGQPGFWRLGQDQSNVWWFISPTGTQEFLNTVTTVQPFQAGRDKNDPHYVSRDWNGGDTLSQGNSATWAAATLKRVRDAGFKGLGAWCNPAFHSLDVPMSQDLNLWIFIADSCKRLYSLGWQEGCDDLCQKRVTPLKDNKNLVGYYLDNELDWGDGFAGPGAYFDHLPANDPNRQQVLRVIHSVWQTISDFNLTWNSKYSDWNEVDSLVALPRENAPAYAQLQHAWLRHLAEDYFRITTSLVHKYDPNHLILGVRYRGSAPEDVVAASKNYTDAQSLNYYVGDAKLDSAMFHMMNSESNQPVIISEYAFHSLDGKSGNRNTAGFDAQVPDQQARADGYHLMTSRLARIPFVVGADWFQWFDESPAGRSGDGEDVNFGIVDIDDNAYSQMVKAIRETTPILNPLHAKSVSDAETDVWRESFATRPVMHVPYLTHPPVLNGNLDHWPTESRLSSIRRAETVGEDRSTVQAPDVCLGWTNDGLYLAMEVFDNHIVSMPASGFWWTRDHVELFLSTQPVASDQATYDANCEQFFFVPSDYANRDGVAGVVGQWHREGDALTDNLIPQPQINPAVRILPDRYVVEMFIPAKTMHGYDPAHQPAMAFNLDVRDFESAAEFFWSAPKTSQTQLRPNTWGQLYLDAPHANPQVANSGQN